MKKVWKALMIAGYVLMGVYGVNLLYVLILYGIRHEDWFIIYNPDFGPHTNPELAWQIIWSTVLILISWGIISISRKRLKVVR